jgi:hypothetical protein
MMAMTTINSIKVNAPRIPHFATQQALGCDMWHIPDFILRCISGGLIWQYGVLDLATEFQRHEASSANVAA